MHSVWTTGTQQILWHSKLGREGSSGWIYNFLPTLGLVLLLHPSSSVSQPSIHSHHSTTSPASEPPELIHPGRPDNNGGLTYQPRHLHRPESADPLQTPTLDHGSGGGSLPYQGHRYNNSVSRVLLPLRRQ